MSNISTEQPPVDGAHNNPGSKANTPAQRTTTTTTTTAPASEETEMGTQYLLAFDAPKQSTATTTVSGGGGSGSKANEVTTTADGAGIARCEVKKVPTEQDAVESIVGSVVWTSQTEGYCTCPGISSHSTKEGTRDCMVYLDHVPTIHCMHSSCRSAVEAKNKDLRRAMNDLQQGDGCDKKKKLTPEQKQRMRERDEKNSIRLRAKASRKQILKDVWLYADICKDSPVAVQGIEENHWKLLVQMFPQGDVIWIGELYASGDPEDAKYFKTREDWLKYPIAPGPFICPAAFKPGTCKRGNEFITARRFLVVESDELNRDQVGAIFKWLKVRVGLKLYAIVDTAGKSLHGWFEFPDAEELEHLKLVLPAFGCDPKLFTPSQPVRLPGALRGDKYQRLVYLAKEVK